MKLSGNLPFVFVIAFFVVGAVIFGWRQFSASDRNVPRELVVPDFSPLAVAGKAAYDKNCAQCHGISGTGTKKGPPLLHDIYNPGHHGDESFILAAKQGVKAHHWNFGNMPPQPQVSDTDLAAIIRYMRELQTANGIVFRQHRM